MPKTPRKPTKAKEPVVKLLNPGICKANCTQPTCPHGMQHIGAFDPAASNVTHRKRNKFSKLVEEIHAIEDITSDLCAHLLRTLNLNVRTKTCLHCRLIMKKSQENPETKVGACRAKWYELKADLDAKGCILCECTDGMSVEHTIPAEKKRDKKGNTVSLGDYKKWPTLGGPKAMQDEYDMESVVPMCMNCQLMQPTHSAMKPKLNPDDLPDGKQGMNATKEENAAHKKKYQLITRHEKQAYVDAKKLEIGECAECTILVVPRDSEWRPRCNGYPHAFQFAHRSELDKKDSVSVLVDSTVTLKTQKPKIDLEIGRCRLLCMNCAKTETDERASCPGASEEGN